MCRHLAYLGPRRTLHDLVYGPPHSLEVQAYAPRMSRSCLLNADGFGVGWYADEDGPGPAAGSGTGSGPGSGPGAPGPVRYRRTGPIWNDVSFAEVARVLRSRCVLAAVRSATPGFPADESCAQPFRAGRWLFSHNGRVDGFPALEGRLREAAHAALAEDGAGIVARVGTPAEVAGTPGTPPSGPGVHAPAAAGTGMADSVADGTARGTAGGVAQSTARGTAGGVAEGAATGSATGSATDVTDGVACGPAGDVTTGEDDGAASGWAGVPDARAPVDSALLFAIAVGRWRRGASLADGLADVVTGVPGLAGSRLNLLATDGIRLAATAWGDTLFTRGDQVATGVVIASEPYDDGPDWKPVPDRSLVIADATGLRVRPLA
jgi:gamma-glutamyl hercynylcysteine S-oxide hydrolase